MFDLLATIALIIACAFIIGVVGYIILKALAKIFYDPDAVYTDEQKIRDIYISIRNENKD